MTTQAYHIYVGAKRIGTQFASGPMAAVSAYAAKNNLNALILRAVPSQSVQELKAQRKVK